MTLNIKNVQNSFLKCSVICKRLSFSCMALRKNLTWKDVKMFNLETIKQKCKANGFRLSKPDEPK